jgi:hypothetical protein
MIKKFGGRKFIVAEEIIAISTVIFIATSKLSGGEFVAIVLGIMGLFGGTNAAKAIFGGK